MQSDKVRVLLIGENLGHSPQLRQWLNERGCHCDFARSYRDACAVLAETDFELVLSQYQLPDRTAYPLLDWLAGTPATLLFSARVGDGILWLKMIERGERCIDTPVLRSNDLIPALEQILTNTTSASGSRAILRPTDISYVRSELVG